MKTPRIFTAITLVLTVLAIANAQEINIQALVWVNPIQQSSGEIIDGYDICTLSTQTPIFQWTMPVVPQISGQIRVFCIDLEPVL